MKPLVLGCIALLIAGCGGTSDVLNSQKLEGQIRHQYDKQGFAVKVACPNNVKIEAGRKFHCIVTDQGGGGNVRVTATIENSDGYVTWEADN